jgi:hypothetical protein
VALFCPPSRRTSLLCGSLQEDQYEGEDYNPGNRDEDDEPGAIDDVPMFSCRMDNAKVSNALSEPPTAPGLLLILSPSPSQAVTATLTCLSNGTKKDQLAQVEVNEEGAAPPTLTSGPTGQAT